jgi:predicted PurR-regulated permease PerM
MGTVEGSDRTLAMALRLVLVGTFLWMTSGLVIPIAFGALFAMLLFPLKRRIDKRLGKRAVWTPALLTTGVVVVVVIPAGLVAAKVIDSLNDFVSRDWPATFAAMREFVWAKVEGYEASLHTELLNPQRFGAAVENLVKVAGAAIASAAQDVATALPGQLLALFLFVLSLFYFLRDGAGLTRSLLVLSPFSRESTTELFDSIHETVNGAILGVSVTALVQGLLTMAALYIFGVPGAFVFGVIATFFALIPLVGTTPITLGAVVYLLAVDRTGAAIGMLACALVIGISDNVVRPWMQSRGSNMHPMLTFLSLFGGIELFGTPGVFLGPVVGAMAMWTVDAYATLRKRQIEREGPASSARPSSF